MTRWKAIIRICLLAFGCFPSAPVLAITTIDQDQAVTESCPACVSTPKDEEEPSAGSSLLARSKSESGSSGMIGEVQGRLRSAIGLLPEETRKAVTTYLDIMKPSEYHGADSSVGNSNAGLGATLQSIYDAPENSCFRSAARDFYDEIKRISLRAHPPKEMSTEGGSSFHFDFGSRPTLKRSAGQGGDEPLEPGWVWDTALRHAHGDANVAMRLIGLCGNDDTQLPSYSSIDRSPQALEAEEELVKQLESDKKKIIAFLGESYISNGPKAQIQYLKAKLRSVESRLKNHSTVRGLDCPQQTSDFYLAKGLGDKADIPQNLKDKILAVEGPSGNPDKIPSKYYHVYGSAFVACEMIERGVAPDKVTETSELAARGYRGIRICGAVAEMNAKRSWYESVTDPNNPAAGSVRLNAAFDELAAKLAKDPKFCKTVPDGSELDKRCKRFGLRMTEEPAKKLADLRARLDAAQLYSAWTLGGQKVAGVTVPCSDVHFFGPKDRMNPTDNWFDRLSQPTGWSKERYTAASRVVATWDADFEWTIAQHKIGAKFAKAVCKKKEGPTDYSALCHNAIKYGSSKKDDSSTAPGKASPNLEMKGDE